MEFLRGSHVKAFIAALLLAALLTACGSAPKPITVDGSSREAVNKTPIATEGGRYVR